jgi:hypothetical protein
LLLVESVAGLVGTAHGHLLLAKLAVLVPALLLAAANRALLPALSGPNEAKPSATAGRMALFIALEAGLVLAVLGLAAAMTVTTPAIHGDPIWPCPSDSRSTRCLMSQLYRIFCSRGASSCWRALDLRLWLSRSSRAAGAYS